MLYARKKRTFILPAILQDMETRDRVLQTLTTMLAKRGWATDRTEFPLDLGGKEEDFEAFRIGEVQVLYSTKPKGISKTDLEAIASMAGGGWTIVISKTPPSENLLLVIKSLAKHRIQFFHVKQLLFDITTHRMAMPHRILTAEEKTELYKQYKITDPENQLPWIDSQDPMVKWIGALPALKSGASPREADIVEVVRHSDVAGRVKYYRLVVDDVNVA